MEGDSSAARPARRPRASRAAPPRAARLPGAASRPATGGKLIEFVAPPRKEKVAITGGSGRIGSRLVKALAARGDRDVVVIDLVPPPDAPADVRHRFLDLNLPHADGALLRILSEEKPDAIVHLACVRSPLRDATYAHELNALGALHVTAAAGEAGISRLVMGSTTLVYGARGDNPNFLSEDHPLRPDPQDRFVRDFVEAESFARAHQKRHPESKVTVLRFAPLTAPDVRDYRQRLFESPYNMTLMGYDPLLQAMSPDDAVEAIRLVLDRHETRGVFNIAPDGVLPLSAFHLLYATLAVPLPHPLAYAAQEAAWLAGVGLMPGVHSDYFRYLCVADNQKAKRVLGFEPNLSTLEAVLATVRVRRGKGRLVSFDELEEVAHRAVYRFSKGLQKEAAARKLQAAQKNDTGSRRAAQ